MPVCLCLLFLYHLRQLYVCSLQCLACTWPLELFEENVVCSANRGYLSESCQEVLPLKELTSPVWKLRFLHAKPGVWTRKPLQNPVELSVFRCCVPQSSTWWGTSTAPGSTWQQGKVFVPRLLRVLDISYNAIHLLVHIYYRFWYVFLGIDIK